MISLQNQRQPVASIVALTVTLLIAAFVRPLVAAETSRPNVIVIFTDDHGFADLSSQNVLDDVRTPNIDLLAKHGVRMTSGYATAPQCVPSRGGLLSGRYQNRFGLESNGESLDGFNAQTTIAERLKLAGYATGMTGKWHLGPHQEITSHGFDDVYYKNSNRPGWANFRLDGSNQTPGPETSDLYHIDANSAAACAFIKRHHKEPFFFYCAYRAPHVPLDAPPRYLNRFPGEMPERRRQALAMLSAVDDGVGQIVATLEEFQLEERTLIFCIGDNGAPLKIHKLDTPGGGPGWDGSLNDPLNGEKGMLSEGGIRVPFVACWKGHLPAGRQFDHPVISLDVAATAISLAGLPADPQLDGVNLVPFLKDETKGAPHDALYWRWIAQAAIREGNWKYLRGGAREYLFDLKADASETRNLIAQHPEIAAKLSNRLRRWSEEMSPPGLETKSMSSTWEEYFDHYLDGKLAAAPRERTAPSRENISADGWVARGCDVEVRNRVLHITPARGSKQRPFIAFAPLEIDGPATAALTIRAVNGGAVGFSWRLEGQREFPSDQVVTAELKASTEWQTLSKKIMTDGKIIHLRVLLPAATTDVERIELSSSHSKAKREWVFTSK